MVPLPWFSALRGNTYPNMQPNTTGARAHPVVRWFPMVAASTLCVCMWVLLPNTSGLTVAQTFTYRMMSLWYSPSRDSLVLVDDAYH